MIELLTPSLAQPPKTLWFDTKIAIFNRIFGPFGYQKLWSRTRNFRDETLGLGLDGENGILKSLGLVSPPRPPKLNSRTRSRLENSGLFTLCPEACPHGHKSFKFVFREPIGILFSGSSQKVVMTQFFSIESSK